MIDIHSHILPGLDDGAANLEVALKIARLAVADGIQQMACTPHVTPGLYNNTTAGISQAVEALQESFLQEDIPLQLFVGADIHATPDITMRLSAGELPTLNGSRYFLFEPSHDVAPPGLLNLVKNLIGKGFFPIVTHPERLRWIEKQYKLVIDMRNAGALIQLTAASIVGKFGSRAQYWSERMLDDRLVDVVASDTHHPIRRPPLLSKARDSISLRMSEKEAVEMTVHTPQAILQNQDVSRRLG
uniref:tyrosine-protein phosphatase n=1 Tax=Pararhizobium sp. IMCC3301 TaxID=3067904 RepID=UPI002740DC45|nr:CpsB/CapC family capsule biosynthesis tyrosine phosphatase [Pararhizobium sp. IMCC3301]